MIILKWLCCIIFMLIKSKLVQCDILFQQHGLPQAVPVSKFIPKLEWNTITQRQDNFDSDNPNTWEMRYIVNPEFYKPGGPIFVMLGGEWEIDETWLLSGQMYEMAIKHQAYMFYTEHRYYGKSYPASNFSPLNLKYLTTEQALADIENFIKVIKKNNALLRLSKVVVFGGSYAGNLAIWLRKIYPEIVHAAVSSSAPVLAQVDFKESFEVIQKNLGSECSEVLTNAFDEIIKLLRITKDAVKIQRDFNLCKALDISNKQDVDYFFLMVISKFKNLLQYAQKNTILDLCTALTKSNGSDYEKVIQYFQTSHCIPSYSDTRNDISNWNLTTDSTRPWMYQCCTQYGFFQTTNSPSQPFRNTLPIEMYYKWCVDFFGSEFTPDVLKNGVQQTNSVYGGLSPNVTRVVSVHGTVDPFHVLGLKKQNNLLAPVIIVNGSSHTQDLYGLSDDDILELRTAKLNVRKYIAQWLQET